MYFQKLNSRDFTDISLYILLFQTLDIMAISYMYYVSPFYHTSMYITQYSWNHSSLQSIHLLFSICPLSVCPTFLSLTLLVKNNSRDFLLSQILIVNYYVKISSNNLSNENIKTVVSEKWSFKNSSLWHFNLCFV